MRCLNPHDNFAGGARPRVLPALRRGSQRHIFRRSEKRTHPNISSLPIASTRVSPKGPIPLSFITFPTLSSSALPKTSAFSLASTPTIPSCPRIEKPSEAIAVHLRNAEGGLPRAPRTRTRVGVSWVSVTAVRSRMTSCNVVRKYYERRKEGGTNGEEVVCWIQDFVEHLLAD